MKISNILLILLFCFGLKTAGQDRKVSNDSIFILIDPQYKELYSFGKNYNQRKTIKILQYDKRELGFETKTEDHEFVVLESPPPNYYEFFSSGKQKEISSIKGLKTFSIEDVSKGDKNVWRHPWGYFYFIEKLDSGNYIIGQRYIHMRE